MRKPEKILGIADEAHVWPGSQRRGEHVLSPDCWCRPREDERVACVWVHNDVERPGDGEA